MTLLPLKTPPKITPPFTSKVCDVNTLNFHCVISQKSSFFQSQHTVRRVGNQLTKTHKAHINIYVNFHC